MFKIKFKIKGKLLALVVSVFVLFVVIVFLVNNLVVAIIGGIFMFFFLRIAKSYAVAKEEADRIIPKKVYLDAKFDNLWEPVHFNVEDKVSGDTYHTELLSQDCDCQEYKDFHSFYSIGDLRRICRHQVKAYVDSGRINNLTEAAQFMVGEAYKKDEGATFREILVSDLGSNPTLFYFDEEPNVTGLIYKDGTDGTYEEFRFNLNDNTWENDFKPAYTGYMEQALTGWRMLEDRKKEKALKKIDQKVSEA